MRTLVLIGVLGALGLLCACHGPLPAQTFGMEPVTDFGPYKSRLAPYKLRGESRPAARPKRPASQLPPVEAKAPRRHQRPGATVRVQPQDMKPVREWFSGRNEQFILGDVVEVRASKEYFSQVLTTNAHIGMVRKMEKILPNGDRVVTLKYIGQNLPSAMNSPRVLIGVGFTAVARDVLRVHFTKTYNLSRPVSIRVTARGDAARGRDDQILQKGETLQIRGALTWNREQRRWVWACG